MDNTAQFNLEVYSVIGVLQLYVDTFAGIIRDKQNNVVIKIISSEKNVIYIQLPNCKYAAALIHNYKYGCLSFINRRSMHYFKDVFILKMEKYQTLYFEISKNACTAIATEIYNHCKRKFFSPKITKKNKWDDIWTKPIFLDGILIQKKDYIHKKNIYSSYKKFLVYDDPIKRFLRAANDKLNGHICIASIIPDENVSNYSEFVDKMILATQMQTLNTTYFDQHLVPISLYVKEFLDEITDFVMLKDLNSFMKEKFNINQQRLHQTDKKKLITADMLSDEQILKLKEIYAEDYNLPIKYKEKFYKS